MSLTEIALRTGVPVADIEALVRGTATATVARCLGVPMLGLQEFLTQGYASANVAHRLGTSMSAAEDLRREIGQDGAVGIVLGLMLSSRRSRAAEAGS